MADRRRGESKQLKKDSNVQRDVLDEVNTEIVTAQGSDAQYRNPNRDQARGDWDRSGRHTDEGKARDSE
jgi:hypothetical protein